MKDLYNYFHLNSMNYSHELLKKPKEYPDLQLNAEKIFTLEVKKIDKNAKTINPFFKIHSSRVYGKQMVSDSMLEEMLVNIYRKKGVNSASVPSAGDFYSAELYIINLHDSNKKRGVYYYDMENNNLNFVHDNFKIDFLPDINAFALQAKYLIVITSKLNQLLGKYGDRGYRYALIEAGHIGQNISLYSEFMGLKACPMGGFYDEILINYLNLEKNEFPLYIYAIGL